MKTDDLIAGLARDLAPVKRLGHPWRRAAAWALGTTAYLAVLVGVMAPPGRLLTAFGDTRFALEQAAAALAGLTAAAAALAAVVPGYGRRRAAAPLAIGLLWISIVVVGMVQDAGTVADASARTDWPCVLTIVIGGALPAVALVRMLRRGAPLAPGLAVMLAALAAASLTGVAACLARPHDTSATVLLWHGTTLALVCGLAAVIGPHLLTWRGHPLRPRSR